MRLLRFETTSAAANLSLDEALLLRVNWGLSSSAFRSWRTSRSTVVLGVGSEAAAECDIEECRRRGVKICRRSSGGAAVLLEAGALCATLVAPYDELRPEFRTIGGAHRLLGGILVRALGRLGVEAHCAGTSDVAAGELKLAGLSQSRKRRAVMIHASVLVDPDMDLMDAALPHPRLTFA